MLIQEMTEAECLSTLTRTRLARLACAHQNQPYIVPIYFAYEQPYLYAFTTPGQKVEWMRHNPLVCLEVDEVEDSEHWTSIVIFGRYEELRDRYEWKYPSLHALELLNKNADWWEPGSASAAHRDPAQPLSPVFYRIRIDRISGPTGYARPPRAGWNKAVPPEPSKLVPQALPSFDNAVYRSIKMNLHRLNRTQALQSVHSGPNGLWPGYFGAGNSRAMTIGPAYFGILADNHGQRVRK